MLSHLLHAPKPASNLLKAMANERRLVILAILSEGEHSVGALEKMVDLSQSALSQHLARLRRDGLVKTRRSAQTIYYSLRSEPARAVMATLAQALQGDRQPTRGAGTTAEAGQVMHGKDD